jgi:hypothetical protein
MAAKKTSSVNVKELLLQKGERVGFIAAAALLLFFLGFGVYVASTSASSTTITNDIAANIKTTKSKMDSPGEPPPPIPKEVEKDPTLLDIKFKDYPTPNFFFNPAENYNPKRVQPKILPAVDAQVEVVWGPTGAYEMILGDDGKPLLGVVVNREVSENDKRLIGNLRRKRPQPTGQQPGARPPQPGLPGGLPPGTTPPPGTPAGGPGGGGKFGGMGPPGGMPGVGQTRAQELQVQYVKLDSKEADQAKPAEALMPLRMVVVTGALPYKKQVEEYVHALTARNIYELGNELPMYAGLVVERQTWSADGKELKEDWRLLDIKADFSEIFAKTMEFEPNEPTPEQWQDPEFKDLAPYFYRVVPDFSHKLVQNRPKLKSGKYAPVKLPAITEALKELKKLVPVTELKTQRQQKLGGDLDPFGDPGQLTRPGGPGGPGDDMPGGIRGGSGPPVGGPGGGVPGKFGRGGGTPDPRTSGLPGQRGNMPGGLPGGLPGGMEQAQPVDVPEDAWLFRFIDVTTEPGFAYKYKVKFKVKNPNFGLDPKTLATPGLAETKELESPFFEIKDLVQSPKDEFVYAAANEPNARPARVTEKMPPPPPAAAADETWLQVHHWFKEVRPKNLSRPEPVGDWLIADIRAIRGQYLSDTPRVELPTWSMTQSKFLLRDVPTQGRPKGAPQLRGKDLWSWEVDFTPQPDQLVVDFEGGAGDHRAANRRTIPDTASMDILLMTDDGKLRVIRSAVDLADPQRKDRVENWNKWLQTVEADTIAAKQQGNNPFGGGGDRGGGGPGGDR